MSARELPAIHATAFRLAARLEQYELDVEELTCSCPDDAAYSRVSEGIGEMRLLCASLPRLSVPWVHLLISQAELTHCFWTVPADGDASAAERCKARHLVAVRALREHCLGQFSRTERVPRLAH